RDFGGSRLANPDTRGLRSCRRAPPRGLAHRARVKMTMFPRFDPYAVLGTSGRDRRSLAALAALAGAAAEIENRAAKPVDADHEDHRSGDTPAKVAKPAKAGGTEAGTLATLAALADPAPEIENPVRWSEVEEQRAASVEYDGNIPRAWAEGFSRL